MSFDSVVAAGATASIVLEFVNPSRQAIAYSLQVLSGVGGTGPEGVGHELWRLDGKRCVLHPRGGGRRFVRSGERTSAAGAAARLPECRPCRPGVCLNLWQCSSSAWWGEFDPD